MNEVKRQKVKGKSRNGFAFTHGLILATFAFLLLPFAFCHPVAAQDNPLDLAPPPLRTVSKDEKTQLNELSDVKNHTKRALELMSDRLGQAEHLSSSSDLDGMFKELGGFQGLLDNTLEFLAKQNSRSGKTLDNYKRFEMGLRAFEPRLETIRRDLPLRYEDYVRKLMVYVRDARSRAIEPMFDNLTEPPKKPGQLLMI